MDRMLSLEMFILLVFLWSGGLACSRDELQMVQIVTKHGTISPSSTFPEDPNSPSVWTEGFNDLTMLGKFQAYALGIFLRNYYGDFITSDPRELEVTSSADKGAVKSTQSFVTALYSPNPYWEVVQNFSWQPIYVKYDTDDNRFLSKRQCLAAEGELQRILYRETSAVLQTYQSLMQYWSMNSGKSLKSVLDVQELVHILLTELAHNLTIPEWSQLYWDELKYLHKIATSLTAKSPKLTRLLGGPLVDYTIKTMKEKVSNDQDPRKVVVYTTQTNPMLGLLSAIDFKEFDYLPPCTTLLSELYKKEGEYFVRYLFLNSTTPHKEPQIIYSLTVPGCTEFCPLEYVIDYTKDIIPKNWERECFLV